MTNRSKDDCESVDESYLANLGGPQNSFSEHSLSSIASHDENFRSRLHATVSLAQMHVYLVENKLTDVTLIAGGKKVNAHRLVLSAASEYFAAMFTSDLKEASQKEIVLQDVDPEVLSSLVHYCYSGRIELKEESVETLLVTACRLRLCRVVDACSAFLKRQLHPSNSVGIYLFADAQGCFNLRDDAFTYIMNNFMEVIKHPEFLILPLSEITKLLGCEDLNVPNEKIIYESLMKWMNHDRESRKSHIAELLALVKLPLLSPAYLVDHLESEPLVKENADCQNLIVEALIYHTLPERRATLPSQRTRPRKSTVGMLYAVGGMESNKAGATGIEGYSLREDAWAHVTSMPGRRLQFGVAVRGNKIYIIGGRDGLKTLNTVEWYDVETGAWGNLPEMGTLRHGLGAAVLSGPLYAVGGHDGWSYLSSVERWDPGLNQWTFVAPMLSQRSAVGVAALNDKLYAIGGRDGYSCLRTVECFNPHINRWLSCAPMAKRRGGVAVCVMNSYLYALGGHDVPTANPSATRFDCVERYDPRTDTWAMVSPMSIGRDTIGVGQLGDKLVTVGGYDGKFYLSLVEAYDPLTNQWTQIAPLNIGRAGSCVVVNLEKEAS